MVSFLGFFNLLLLQFLIVGCAGLMQQRGPVRSAEVRDFPHQARTGDELRKKILVLPFIDSELQRSHAVTEIARRTVVEELVKTGQFVVINNNDFPQDLRSFQRAGGDYDMEAVSRIAASMGITAVMEGKVVDIRARRAGDELGVFRQVRASVNAEVQVRVWGARVAKEIFSGTRQATVESSVTRALERSESDRHLSEDPTLIRQGVRNAFQATIPSIVRAVEKLHWEGRVALVSGDRVYVNAGRISGIQVGDILKIVEEGREVYDPDTGIFIGNAPGRMKGTVEVVTYFGQDGSIGVVHSGSGFKENDRVELY